MAQLAKDAHFRYLPSFINHSSCQSITNDFSGISALNEYSELVHERETSLLHLEQRKPDLDMIIVESGGWRGEGNRNSNEGVFDLIIYD